MGSVYSAQKNQSKLHTKNRDLKTNNQPYIQPQNLVGQSQTSENKLENPNDQQIQVQLQLFKRFCLFLDFVGNLDQLPKHTREKVNSCIIAKQNISIIIQNNIKRNDHKFASVFNQMMQKLSNIIITDPKPDEDFQSAFPIFAVSFEEEAIKISQIVEKINNIQIIEMRKGSSQHSLSINQLQQLQKSSKK